jgi:PGF-pre-PGF domain-containing protein
VYLIFFFLPTESIKVLDISRIAIYILAIIVLIGQAQAATIIVSPYQGQTFNLNITIDPLGAAISGAQLNLAYNRSLLNVNSITEGNLFEQNGANTFFNGGTINNSKGTVENIFGVILGPYNISNSGTFISVNLTAIGQSDSTGIDLSNVKISNPDGMAVPLDVINGRIIVNSPPAPTSTPTNPGQGNNGVVSGSGSAASGGGGSGSSSGENYTNIEFTEKYDQYIYKAVTTSYKFRKLTNPIVFVNITGNTNSVEITTSVEVLKGNSTLVKISPPELVYKNINIWVGTFGYATPKNIKHAEVIFKVPIEWMETNNIDPESIEMMRYDDGWQSLPTRKLGGYNNDILYETDTLGFSEFSILGKIAGGQIDFQKYRDSQKSLDIEDTQQETNETMPSEPENPGGFNKYLLITAFAGIMTSSILGYKKSKN